MGGVGVGVGGVVVSKGDATRSDGLTRKAKNLPGDLGNMVNASGTGVEVGVCGVCGVGGATDSAWV